jgi:hypothetical protein
MQTLAHMHPLIYTLDEMALALKIFEGAICPASFASFVTIDTRKTSPLILDKIQIYFYFGKLVAWFFSCRIVEHQLSLPFFGLHITREDSTVKLISAFILFLLSKDAYRRHPVGQTETSKHPLVNLLLNEHCAAAPDGGLVEYTQIMCLNELERMQINDDFGEAE